VPILLFCPGSNASKFVVVVQMLTCTCSHVLIFKTKPYAMSFVYVHVPLDRVLFRLGWGIHFLLCHCLSLSLSLAVSLCVCLSLSPSLSLSVSLCVCRCLSVSRSPFFLKRSDQTHGCGPVADASSGTFVPKTAAQSQAPSALLKDLLKTIADGVDISARATARIDLDPRYCLQNASDDAKPRLIACVVCLKLCMTQRKSSWKREPH